MTFPPTPQAADAFALAWDETRDGPRENRPAKPDYRALLEMAVDALESLKKIWPNTDYGAVKQPDFKTCLKTWQAVNTTLTTIKTALEGK